MICACSMFQKKPLIQMDAAASWSADARHALIIQYSFRTDKKDLAYFNAHNADDWRIVCYETDELLKDPKQIASWTSDSRDGGGILQKPVFYLRPQKRIIFTESQIPTVYAIDQERPYEMWPPKKTIEQLVEADLIDGVSGDSPIPAPDGKTIAVWFNTSYIAGGPYAPQIHTHFVSFFKSSNGSHIRSQLLPFDDKELDPWLLPASQIHHFRHRFIWNKASTGVYVISKKQAWLISTQTEPGLQTIDQIPARAVPTNIGPVHKNGGRLTLKNNKNRPNSTKIEIQKLKDWIPYDRIPLVSHKSILYAKP